MTPETRKAEILRLTSENLSAKEIAARIGNGCTRGVVIGLWNRNGIKRRQKAREAKTVAKLAPSAIARRVPKSVAEAVPIVLVFGAASAIAALTSRACRYPIGDPRLEDFRFCGASKPFDRSYCDACQHLVYAGHPSRRAA